MVTKLEIQKHLKYLKNGASKKFIELFNNFDEEDLCDRKNFTGHITASGTIIHIPTREVLLLHHKTLDKWHIPGGHVDLDDDSLFEAALREVEEETGLTAEQLIPINLIKNKPYCVEINSHPIPRNEKKNEDQHYHHDFRFVFAYTGNKRIHIDLNESLDYKWLSIDDPYLQEIMTTPETLDSILLEGLESYEQSVKLVRHNDYLVTPLASYLFRLGQHHYDRGNWESAEQMFRRSVSAYENTYDDEYETPPSILAACWNLATVYEKTNRHSQKLQALEKGLNFAKEFSRLDENFLPEISEFTERIDASRHSTGQL